MRKYFQITFVLGGFFLLVFIRNLKGNQDKAINQLPIIVSPPQNSAGFSLQVFNFMYKDGIYTGNLEDAYYGNVQVQATITNGKISDVIFLDHPKDNHTSQSINNQAMPLLKQEALVAQSAKVDGVSGASETSAAFVRSLGNALSKAK